MMTSRPQSYDAIVATPWPECKLGLVVAEAGLCAIDFLPPTQPTLAPRTALGALAAQELAHYFQHPHQQFSVPLVLAGTPYQQRVWRQLQHIAAGHTATYGSLAHRLHSGARAVGNACRANPIPIIIPCHRVVAAQGLGGYMGAAHGAVLNIKQRLLAHESARSD